MIDGYEEYGQARTRTPEPTKNNETPQHVPQGFTPHPVCPGSLVTHCGVLTTLNMVARSPCNYLVQLSCRLVYALLKANPVNVVVLEAFDVIQGLYGSLAGLVAKCCKLQQKNGNNLVKKNRNNGEIVKSGVENSEIASNFPSSSSNIDPTLPTDIIKNRVPISVTTVPNPIIQNISTSTSSTNPNFKKNKKTEINIIMNTNTNINSNLETKTEIKKENKTKARIKLNMNNEGNNRDGVYDLHAGCTDLVPLILDLTCVLQYVAVVTSERENYFLRFLLHLVVSMSITPSTPSSSTSFPSSSSSSSSSSLSYSSSSFNQARESNETKEDNNTNNDDNQKQNRINSDVITDKNTDSKTVIIDPGPVPLIDPLTRTLQLFPFLRTYQYSQYVTDCDSIERETVVKNGEEKVRVVGIEKEIEAGIRKKMTIDNDQKGANIVGTKKTEESKRQKEGAVVRTGEGAYVTKDIETETLVQEPHIDQKDSRGGAEKVERRVEKEVEKELENKVEGGEQDVGETVVDGDKVVEGEEEEKEEAEVVVGGEEVEECHKEEVLCVLLFALKGSVDDTIVSTTCSCCCSTLLLFTAVQSYSLFFYFYLKLLLSFYHFVILSFYSFYCSNYLIC